MQTKTEFKPSVFGWFVIGLTWITILGSVVILLSDLLSSRSTDEETKALPAPRRHDRDEF